MLKRENELRLSPTVQDQFLQNQEPNDVYPIVEKLQRSIVCEALMHFKIVNDKGTITEKDIENGLRIMNSINIRFGNKDEQINESVMYLKYNRQFLLDETKFLKVGQRIPFTELQLISVNPIEQSKLDNLMSGSGFDSTKSWLLVTGSIS